MDRMQKYIDRANILVEALPYIKQFHGKTVVIKYGGSFMYDQDIKQTIMDDIALMKLVGVNPIVVHGGGKDISAMLTKLNVQTEFVDGLRVTTEKVVGVAEMVLSGKINKEIVQMLCDRDMRAIGISGKDDGMLKVVPKKVAGGDIGFVGEIIRVKSDLLKTLMAGDFIPVIAPIGADHDGQTYNINADHVAYAVAKELKAEKLIYLTDTDGVYADYGNPDSVIRRLAIDMVPDLIEQGVISGGMIPKVENAVDAIEAGVSSVHILDGKLRHAMLVEMFTAAGCGTMIRRTLPTYLKEKKDA